MNAPLPRSRFGERFRENFDKIFRRPYKLAYVVRDRDGQFVGAGPTESAGRAIVDFVAESDTYTAPFTVAVERLPD